MPKTGSFIPHGLAILAAMLGVCALAACTSTKAFISSGNAEGVEIGYAGDPDTAVPLARKHCAEYEKVPELVTAGENIATYRCEPR